MISRGACWRLGACIGALVAAAVPLRLVAQTPWGQVTPSSGTYPAGTQISIQVQFCSPSSWFDAWALIFHNGQQIGTTFPVPNPGCNDYQENSFNITIVEGNNHVYGQAFDGNGMATAEAFFTGTPVSTYGVAVAPDGGTTPTRQANTTGYSATFTVQNTGNTANTYTISCAGSSNVTCTGVSSGSVPLGAGASTAVNAFYNVGAPGSGSLTLTASGTNASDGGSFTVPVAQFGVVVTPDGASGPTRVMNTTGHTAVFTVRNAGSVPDNYSLACTGSANVTCTLLSPLSLSLAASNQADVTATYNVGASGAGSITLTATGTSVNDGGSYNFWVTTFTPAAVVNGVLAKDSRYLLQETAVTYDGYGRVTQLSDARSKVTNYQYGPPPNNAFLTQVTRVHDAGGANLVTDIAYDANGFVFSIRDEGVTFRYFTYDEFGRLRQIKNNAGTPVRAYGYTYSRTSPSWTFNPASPNAIVDTTFVQQTPLVAVVSTQFMDGLGRPIQTVVRDGTNYHVSGTQYDLMGRVWRVWKPYTRATPGFDASFTTSATNFYNTYHATATAKPYVETSYTPDALARVKQVTPEYIGTSPTAFVLHAYGLDVPAKHQYIEVTDETGKKTRRYTDVFGNAMRSLLGYGAPEATTTQFTYNVLGQRTQATDPRALNTTYAFDTRGLLTSRTSPDAGTVNSKYDKAGNLRFSQDANQAAAGQVYFTNYDFAGRPLTSGQGSETFATLNPDVANSFEGAQANWLVVRQYDAAPPLIPPWSFLPTPPPLTNVAGRLAGVASKSNGAWQVTYFSYDADGQVATRYTYTQANGGGSVLTALNTTATYARDLRGSLTQRSLTVGTNTFYHWYDYDSRGLLWKLFASTTFTKPPTPDVTDTYLPGGQPQNYQFQGGPLVPIRYTIRGQTEKVGDPALTTYPFSARYAYRPNGVVDTAEFYNAGSPAAQKRYRYAFGTAAYDALNRLKSADFSSWSGSAWTSTLAYDLANIGYDAAGNLTALQRYRETATLIDNLTYSNATTSNRLNSITDAVSATTETWDAETGGFTYDANGNLLTAPAAPYSITTPITYNHQNLPVSLTSGANTATYRYDDAGQRITKQVNSGNTEVYVRDGATTLGVFTVNGAGTPTSWHFNLLWEDRVVGRQPNTGNRRYYHFDHLGSTRAVVEGATVVESYDFEPWGLLMPGRTLAGPTKEGFTGKEQDAETGLEYFGARYYLPALARWGAVDPLAAKYREWSPYNYVLNNPLVLYDPDGRQARPNPGSARSPDIRIPALRPSRPWIPGELATQAIVGSARSPEIRELAVSSTPLVSTLQDVSTLRGYNLAAGRDATSSEQAWAFAGIVTPLSGPLLKKLFGGLFRRTLKGADTWGRPETLERHFRDHGADFGARNADEYAQGASDFFQRSQRDRLPTKIDSEGGIRVYDPATNTFGAYNADGTTRSFYKPDPSKHGRKTNLDYWNDQPGTLVP